ncbi:ABC transporter permease [Candidatus Pacearchaeota archaeon]|nr:ABC transporter permease [Candidatus Pacearchaeota archaeon]
MMKDYFSFAIKNSKKRGLRSWLTLLGIFIGIVTVISLITVGDGLQTAVNSQFGISSTQVITVQAGGLNYGAPGATVSNPLTRDDAEAIHKLSTIEYAIPRNIEFGEMEFNNQIGYGYAISMIEGYEKEIYELLDVKAEKGRLLTSGDFGKVMLGNNFADGTKNGFDKDIEVGKKVLIEGKKFAVVGIMEKKGSFMLDGIVLMNDEDLDDLMGYGEEVGLIGVKVKDKDLLDKAKEDIEKLLRKRRNVKVGEEDFEVSTPDAALDQVNSVLNAVQIFIVLIASIAIFVGALGIVNTMATSVVERKKEIGIMKAIGARNSQIFYQFFVESGFMGLVGGILGIIGGLGIGYFGILALNNFIGSTTTPEINLPLIFFALVGSFMVGAVAGIVPAMNAAKQNPVEALRG